MNSSTLSYPEDVRVQTPVAYRACFFEKQVLRVFTHFKQGGMLLHLQNGETLTLGQQGAPITAEIRVRHPDFFKRCALYGNVGFGEAYVEGDWDTPDLFEVISWLIRNLHHQQGSRASSSHISGINFLKFVNRIYHAIRPNSLRTSSKNIAEHYDLGNDFYSLWLDESMTYSAAKFTHPDEPLHQAQWNKYEALCKKLQLKSTDHVLEIGCGWGGFCTHAAREHGCRVTAITISKEQLHYTKDRVKKEGLEHLIEVQLQDYRLLDGSYDKIASIEMLEAVGDAYVDGYFAKCQQLLKTDGLLAFQVITTPDCRYDNLRKGVDWIQKHIFPGSLLLSMARINGAINRTSDLFLHEIEDLGSGYARTLKLWHERFHAKLQDVKKLGFDESFIRKWTLYLKYCEAAFATRNISVIQAVYTRPNNETLHRAW